MTTERDPLPPAFFPVSLNLVGRRCIVIGDDREAREKEAALREVGADVLRVDVTQFEEVQLRDVFFVINTAQDEVFSARLRELADRDRFLFCAIDQPAHGFVAMQAIVKAGPARIAISTGGVSPRVGKILKEAMQDAFDAKFARFLECLGMQRRRNRTRLHDRLGRREAMLEAAAGFTVELTVRYPAWFEAETERAPALHA